MNIEKKMVYSANEAKNIATDAFNAGENDMRAYFKQRPTTSADDLGRYWIQRAQHHMAILSLGRGRVGTQGSINNAVPVVIRPYEFCY